ncbi:ACP phosphodiesterase [Vibrio vulnificus]
MNYLAHLHLADVANSDMLGNLLGDFAKGDPSKLYSLEIVQGIRLHRAVDKFVDTHGIVQACKKRFPEQQRRFALIALDMFWDHCLAMHWHRYSDISLDSFVHYAQREVAKHDTKDLPRSFLLLNQRMWQDKWLQSYREMDNIEFALHRMSQRRPRLSPLSECHATLQDEYEHFSSAFETLYADTLQFSCNQQKEFGL